MDLASGYSDSTNYGNGYTPLANNAIANNNADYLRNQLAMQQAGQYNPFAQSGGFGAMTDYYSGMGAAYGRATGGFNATPAYPSGDVQRGPDLPDLSVNPFAGMSSSDMATWQRAMGQGGIGSDAARSPGQYQSPAVDWNSVFSAYTQPAWSRAPQVEPNSPGSNSETPSGWSQTPGGNPDMQRLLGYTPQTPYSGGGIGSDMARAPYQPGNTQNPYASQPWWSTFERNAGPQGTADWLKAQGVQPQQPQQMIGMTPANGPYPNLGYNPGMANSFANPTMQQYDWTKNNDQLQRQMQDALKTIDGATGNAPAQPYGGQLPDFWQGVRDWTGMGAPQPTPTRDTWTNAS